MEMHIQTNIDAHHARPPLSRPPAFDDSACRLPSAAGDPACECDGNRELLEYRLNVALTAARRARRPLAVLRVRLDRVRIINDMLGRQTGNRFLRQAASRIAQSLRPCDIAARYGADEFVVLLHRMDDPGAALQAARRILERFAAPLRVGRHSLFAAASIGISLFPAHGDNWPALLGKAESALNRAGGIDGCHNIHMFAEHMNRDARHAFNLDQNLRGALDGRQFSLVYQPIVVADHAEISSLEALLRWSLPDGAPVPPAEFIPVAEDNGLIIPIGQWALTEACRQVQYWRRTLGHSPRISVNLSPRQFRAPDLADSVLAVIHAHGIDPCAIELEITETSLMRDIDDALPKLRRLTAAGVRLAIDDFGTGYSSLSYLRKLPVDTIKIDQSFVRDLPADPAGRTIVRAIIELAERLGLASVAEGVESAEQIDILRSLGCHCFQGFYLARPAAAAEIEHLLLSPAATDHRRPPDGVTEKAR
jgi:diguanylate cyclase (GGDEF)-like protein